VKNPECQVSEIRDVRVSSFFIGKKEDEVPRFYINFRNPREVAKDQAGKELLGLERDEGACDCFCARDIGR
jgi:hypothetical protein